MATYYVRKTGSDAAAGTSPATAWATIGKALSSGSITGGDTVYVGAGTYRETITMTAGVASLVQLIADVDGRRTGDAGEVRLTGYLTSDTAAPSTGRTLNLNSNGNLTFQGFTIDGGGTQVLYAGTSNAAANVTFIDCTFYALGTASGNLLSLTVGANTTVNWLFDRCRFVSLLASAISIALNKSSSADYDANIVFRDCLALCPAGFVSVSSSGGVNTFLGGGVDLMACTIMASGNGGALTTAASQASTTTPCTVTGCLLLGGGLSAGTSGQVTEDYNLIYAATPRTNVTAGAHSVADRSYAPLVSIGQEHLIGSQPRHIFTPLAGSPLLGFGTAAGGGNSAPTVDLLNRARPEGGLATVNAVGALERHDTGTRSTTVVRTGANALKLAGPASQDFALPVDASATTVTVYAQYDASYGAGTLPQLVVTNGGECGVADAGATMSAVGASTWAQLSVGPFTPTAAGVVTVRLVSSAAAAGAAYFDDVGVA